MQSLIFTLHACRRPRDRAAIAEIPRKKINFAHRSNVVARSGSRKLRAVKVPASYHAWRPPTRKKNDSEKLDFFQRKILPASSTDHRTSKLGARHGGKAWTSFQKICPSGKFFEMIFEKNSEIPGGLGALPRPPQNNISKICPAGNFFERIFF